MAKAKHKRTPVSETGWTNSGCSRYPDPRKGESHDEALKRFDVSTEKNDRSTLE
jgi:hypothetical protein